MRPARVAETSTDAVALHQRLLRGERAAAAILFDRHAPMVERLLLRILGSDSELNDLVHEVFVRAFESAHRLRDPDVFAGVASAACGLCGDGFTPKSSP